MCLIALEWTQFYPGSDLFIVADKDSISSPIDESVDSYDSVVLETNDIVLDEMQDSLSFDPSFSKTEETTFTIESNDVIQSQPSGIDAIATTAAPKTFNVLLPTGNYLIECNESAYVYKNEEKVKIPFACREYGLSIKNFLEKNPNTTLQIVGFSDPLENPYIGKNRAEYVERLLKSAGIPEDQIITSVAIANLDIEKGYAEGGIRMELKGKVSNLPATVIPTNESVQINSKTNNTTKETSAIFTKKFTSGFQDDYFYGDQNFTSSISQLKELLRQNPESKIYAYSYSGTDGNAQDNFTISRDNASTVRKILIQSGIPANKIQSVAKGGQSSGTTGSSRSIIITIK